MNIDESKSNSLQCLKNSTKQTTGHFILDCYHHKRIRVCWSSCCHCPLDNVQRFLLIFIFANNAVFWGVKRTCLGHMRIVLTMDEMGDISREACGHNGGPAVKGHCIGQAGREPIWKKMPRDWRNIWLLQSFLEGARFLLLNLTLAKQNLD